MSQHVSEVTRELQQLHIQSQCVRCFSQYFVNIGKIVLLPGAAPACESVVVCFQMSPPVGLAPLYCSMGRLLKRPVLKYHRAFVPRVCWSLRRSHTVAWVLCRFVVPCIVCMSSLRTVCHVLHSKETLVYGASLVICAGFGVVRCGC